MSPIITIILAAIKSAAPLVPVPGATYVPAVIDAIPDIESAIEAAMQAQGYSNEQIDLIFSDVLPFEQLGIDPNHPVKPEPAALAVVPPLPAAAAPAPAMVPNPIVHAPFVTARPHPAPAPAKPVFADIPGVTDLKPAISTAEPLPPPPFERAR